ncbi:T9SS type A sorting domain-containing protein [bacterium]|nr:T9SS type A sorting domain-containing protein [bacterium]
MRRSPTFFVLMFVLAAGLFGIGSAFALTPIEELGRFLYFDTNLSTPPGQSCASCHAPEAGFADPDFDLPVSAGALPGRFGNRNSPSSAYMAFSPDFYYDEEEEMYIGGQFWDGRAANLVEQAKGPFLNPLEMHNPNKNVVIVKIRQATYAHLFLDVFGENSLSNVSYAYDRMAEAIGAFEETDELNQFTSKYDYYLMGMAELTEQEMLGLQLYNDENAGNCAACHPSTAGPYSDHPLFTDYSYDNLGVPKNWENPFLYMPPAFNRAGKEFIDYGLGGVLDDPMEIGKFKVPTLRNIAVTPPYMHNGIFDDLTKVVDFYNTRDVGEWAPPEVEDNVNHDELGDLGLDDDEVDAIVAFMMTLTDGYDPVGRFHAGGSQAIVGSYELRQNYPNPFNPSTTIAFELAEASNVRLEVFNITGQKVSDLLNSSLNAGRHEIVFDGNALSSGVYLYRLTAGSFTAQKKMVLMK